MFHDIPNQADVYAEVLVGQDISQTCNLLPGDGRKFIGKLFNAEVSYRLINDLEVSNHSILRIGIADKCFSAVGGVIVDAHQAQHDMP